jgi:hypothetical protein
MTCHIINVNGLAQFFSGREADGGEIDTMRRSACRPWIGAHNTLLGIECRSCTGQAAKEFSSNAVEIDGGYN